MIFQSTFVSAPRAWLDDIVKPTVEDFIAEPLEMHRAYAALQTVYQYHERLFHYLQANQAEQFVAGSVEAFRRDLTGATLSFEGAASAADPKSGHTLAYSNILSAGALLAILSAPRSKVHRAIIVTRLNRQLLPLLQDLIGAYERLLEKLGL